MADITYCTSECPFKDCERHKSKISKAARDGKGWVSIADFAPTCRRYIASVVARMAKEYIERGALYEKAYWHGERPDFDNPFAEGVDAVDIADVDAIPAADVVEVVRCKDCKHWKHFDHLGCTDFIKVCGLANYMIGENGYCLYGERRDNNAAD